MRCLVQLNGSSCSAGGPVSVFTLNELMLTRMGGRGAGPGEQGAVGDKEETDAAEQRVSSWRPGGDRKR
jgi:hypothetical protein